jgi:hypothetical protein
MVKIASVTVGASGSSSIEFANIPQTFTDLRLTASLRGSNAGTRDDFQLLFNNSTSGYSRRRILGYDSNLMASDSASSQAAFNPSTTANTATASIFGLLEFYIPNYTSANYKSFSTEEMGENNSASSWIIGLQAGLWSNTAAITQINLTPYSSRTFLQYSSATLYGILKA